MSTKGFFLQMKPQGSWKWARCFCGAGIAEPSHLWVGLHNKVFISRLNPEWLHPGLKTQLTTGSYDDDEEEDKDLKIHRLNLKDQFISELEVNKKSLLPRPYANSYPGS